MGCGGRKLCQQGLLASKVGVQCGNPRVDFGDRASCRCVRSGVKVSRSFSPHGVFCNRGGVQRRVCYRRFAIGSIGGDHCR